MPYFLRRTNVRRSDRMITLLGRGVPDPFSISMVSMLGTSRSFSKRFLGEQQAFMAMKKAFAVNREGVIPTHNANLCGIDASMKWQIALFSSGYRLSREEGELLTKISVWKATEMTRLRQANHSAKFEPLLLSEAKRSAAR
ncbi:hypothetical protein O181_021306 [Austropuccinia psidii MF-1]|uniref:Uncharacterized protein n=1 Tax=Austropuccinia psidii MF-1 TaxID=1389203 RepID=A0A9Q3CAS6_9BASI|nr:hypothetical protein [Austropuccinia psidii MF-1]